MSEVHCELGLYQRQRLTTVKL